MRVFAENNNKIKKGCILISQNSLPGGSIMQMIKFGALAWYGKLTWESAHAWILKILCYLIVWGITLVFMVRLSFHAIPLLIDDVMNDITIIP